MSSKNNKLPRNSFVVAMNARNRKQIFAHKAEDRGGDKNMQREYLAEALDIDEDCIMTDEQVKFQLETIEAKLGHELGIKEDIRNELFRLDRAGQLKDTELVARWHELLAIYLDSQEISGSLDGTDWDVDDE